MDLVDIRRVMERMKNVPFRVVAQTVEYLEQLAAAYFSSVAVAPDDAMLVCEMSIDGRTFKWYFAKKQDYLVTTELVKPE